MGSFEAYEDLNTKLVDSNKFLEAAQAKVASLSKKMTRGGSGKEESDKAIAGACEESEKRLLRLKVALAGHDRAEKLALLLVNEYVNALKVMS